MCDFLSNKFNNLQILIMSSYTGTFQKFTYIYLYIAPQIYYTAAKYATIKL